MLLTLLLACTQTYAHDSYTKVQIFSQRVSSIWDIYDELP